MAIITKQKPVIIITIVIIIFNTVAEPGTECRGAVVVFHIFRGGV